LTTNNPPVLSNDANLILGVAALAPKSTLKSLFSSAPDIRGSGSLLKQAKLLLRIFHLIADFIWKVKHFLLACLFGQWTQLLRRILTINVEVCVFSSVRTNFFSTFAIIDNSVSVFRCGGCCGVGIPLERLMNSALRSPLIHSSFSFSPEP